MITAIERKRKRNRLWAAAHPDYNRDYQRKWRTANREHRRELDKKQRERDRLKPGHRKAIFDKWLLKAKYGLTKEAYNLLLEEQKRGCAICFCPMNPKKRFAVDHNHKTGKVRGLLCDTCNVGLGQFKDDLNLLERAQQYLRKHNEQA